MLNGKTQIFSSMKSIHAGYMNACDSGWLLDWLHHNSMDIEPFDRSRGGHRNFIQISGRKYNIWDQMTSHMTQRVAVLSGLEWWMAIKQNLIDLIFIFLLSTVNYLFTSNNSHSLQLATSMPTNCFLAVNVLTFYWISEISIKYSKEISITELKWQNIDFLSCDDIQAIVRHLSTWHELTSHNNVKTELFIDSLKFAFDLFSFPSFVIILLHKFVIFSWRFFKFKSRFEFYLMKQLLLRPWIWGNDSSRWFVYKKCLNIYEHYFPHHLEAILRLRLLMTSTFTLSFPL